MNNKFDELTKSLAQSVTRRGALKQFGVGLASMALAAFGLATRAEAQPNCLQAGVLCYSGSLVGNPWSGCKKCCGEYRCYNTDTGNFHFIKNCYCQ